MNSIRLRSPLVDTDCQALADARKNLIGVYGVLWLLVIQN